MSLIECILETWVDGVCRFAWGAIIAVLAITYGLFAYTAENLSINTNTTDMLSEELPFRQRYIEYGDAFPQLSDLMTIVVEAATADRADVAALKLADRLRRETDTVEKLYDFAGESFFRKNGLLYKDIEELEELADRLSQAQGLLGSLTSDPSIRGLSEILRLVVEDMRAGNAPIGDLSVVFDRIAEVVEAHAEGRMRELSWRSLISGKDPKPSDLRRFLQVRVKADWSSLTPAAPAMRAIRKIAEEEGLTPENGVRVRLTGGLALSTEELSSVFEGAKSASLLSLTLVSICLLFGLRSLTLVVATVVMLICGLIWTAGFATAVVGHLNLLSVAFAVLFIGLGVDFGIHLALRFAEEFRNDIQKSKALRIAARAVGGAMALCAISAAIGFYAFLPTAYLGLAELGVISGTSMFIALFMSLTLLPAILRVAPVRRQPENSVSAAVETAGPIHQYGRPISLGMIAVAAVSVVFVPNIRFDFDPLNLHDPSTESVQTTLDLIRDSETSPKKISILRKNVEAAESLAARLIELDEVSRAISVKSFLAKSQDDKISIIRDLEFVMLPVFDSEAAENAINDSAETDALKALGEELAQLTATENISPAIVASSARLRGAIQTFLSQSGEGSEISNLRAGLLGLFPVQIEQLKTALQAEPFVLTDVPLDLRERYLASNGVARVEVTPAFSVETNADLLRFIQAVQAIAPDATGSPVVILEASRAVVDAILQAVITAGVLIVLLLAAVLRNVRDTLLVFYPLVLAALFTITVAVIFDLAFNFANVIVLPLLMGLGVASGIHMVIRARGGSGSVSLLQTSTPRAVTFSALTTILSFGSLAVSGHRGTASMGILLMIAIGFTLLGSLVALPAMMSWLKSRQHSS
ncbi:MAG: MMPL family transporter [Pseudomonadota bacterium]|nr:MMPL family transporter [Pseudomonadota bacterium]